MSNVLNLEEASLRANDPAELTTEILSLRAQLKSAWDNVHVLERARQAQDTERHRYKALRFMIINSDNESAMFLVRSFNFSEPKDNDEFDTQLDAIAKRLHAEGLTCSPQSY